jgi:hypothetical protein
VVFRKKRYFLFSNVPALFNFLKLKEVNVFGNPVTKQFQHHFVNLKSSGMSIKFTLSENVNFFNVKTEKSVKKRDFVKIAPLKGKKCPKKMNNAIELALSWEQLTSELLSFDREAPAFSERLEFKANEECQVVDTVLRPLPFELSSESKAKLIQLFPNSHLGSTALIESPPLPPSEEGLPLIADEHAPPGEGPVTDVTVEVGHKVAPAPSSTVDVSPTDHAVGIFLTGSADEPPLASAQSSPQMVGVAPLTVEPVLPRDQKSDFTDLKSVMEAILILRKAEQLASRRKLKS